MNQEQKASEDMEVFLNVSVRKCPRCNKGEHRGLIAELRKNGVLVMHCPLNPEPPIVVEVAGAA